MISFEGSEIKNAFDHQNFSHLELFPSPTVLIKESLIRPENVILNWAFFFAPTHPLLKVAIDEIVNNSKYVSGKEFRNVGAAVVHSTGPLIFTHAVWRYLLKSNYRLNQMSFDFGGKGVFKAVGRSSSYRAEGHYSKSPPTKVFR